MGKRRYDDLRKDIELANEIEQYIRTNSPATEEQINGWRKKEIRRIRDKIAQIDREFPDPLEKPLTERWRGTIDEDCGESGYDYRILPTENPDDWTDDDIDEYIMCEVGYPPINSPYDCTGKRFTMWTSWSRQPIGIVMIHAWGLDV